MKTLYQISATGRLLNMDGEKTYYSKDVYTYKPTTLEINMFIDKCCNNIHPDNLYDLDIDTIKINIHQLNVN